MKIDLYGISCAISHYRTGLDELDVSDEVYEFVTNLINEYEEFQNEVCDLDERLCDIVKDFGYHIN